jgi:hypothetical protein
MTLICVVGLPASSYLGVAQNQGPFGKTAFSTLRLASFTWGQIDEMRCS